MKINDQHSFIKLRQKLEQEYFTSIKQSNVINSISSVDITTTDLCNRTCVFCPRHDPKVYPNRNLRMTVAGATVIAEKLSDINYKGTIAISGFGENLLNSYIVEIVDVFKKSNPSAHVECNTNGDPLKRELAEKLFETGLDCLNINLYDGPEQVEKFDKLLKGLPEDRYKYRVHWKTSDHGIIYNNRSGVIKWMGKDQVESVQNQKCYYPFYKMMVDWNGDVLFCANDWGRTRVIGNLLQQSVSEVWMSSHMKKIRLRLAEGDRSHKPCNTCSVNGTLVGEKSFKILMDYYENSDNRIN